MFDLLLEKDGFYHEFRSFSSGLKIFHFLVRKRASGKTPGGTSIIS